MLDDVIAVLISGQGNCRLQNLSSGVLLHLANGAMLQYPLYHSAAVRVCRQTHHIALDILHSEAVTGMLSQSIAVRVHGQMNRIAVDLLPTAAVKGMLSQSVAVGVHIQTNHIAVEILPPAAGLLPKVTQLMNTDTLQHSS